MRISDGSSDVCSSDLSIAGDWMFLGLDTDIQTSVGDLPDADGALPGFELGSRVYLTLSDGERASFTFTPTPESIGNQTFYRPAWTADDGHGYVLESDRQSTRLNSSP